MPLAAQDVFIKTATVTISVLQVNAKQMTLAVFRQLPKVDPMGGALWDWFFYDGETPEGLTERSEFFDGPLWGRVKYLCENQEEWLVWKYGELLVRWPLEHVGSLSYLPMLYSTEVCVREAQQEKREFRFWETNGKKFCLGKQITGGRPESIAAEPVLAELEAKIKKQEDFLALLKDKRAELLGWLRTELPQLFIAV